MAACSTQETFYNAFFYPRTTQLRTISPIFGNWVTVKYNGEVNEGDKHNMLDLLTKINGQFLHLPVVSVLEKSEKRVLVALSRTSLTSERPARKIELELDFSTASKIAKVVIQERPWTPPASSYRMGLINRKRSSSILDPLRELPREEHEAEMEEGSPSKQALARNFLFNLPLTDEEARRLREHPYA